MTPCEVSQAIIQAIALVLATASALFFFHAFSGGWQRADAEQIGGGLPLIPKSRMRRLAYCFLTLGFLSGILGIWAKQWNPWCAGAPKAAELAPSGITSGLATQAQSPEMSLKFLEHPLSKHPLVIAILQLGLAASLAYILTERWQRWRQRREFQFRALARFSELSEEAFSRLSELLVSRARIDDQRHRQLRRDYMYHRGPLLGMEGEISTAFKDPAVFEDFNHMSDVMRILYHMACATNRTPPEQYQPVQRCMAARRRLMMARMAREMRFLSGGEFRQILQVIEPKAQLPAGVAQPAEEIEAE